MDRSRLRPFTRRRLLWLILGLAFVLRAGWGMTRPADDASIDTLPDQREYLSLARHLLGHEAAPSARGRLWFYDPRFRDTLYAYRMPGYPAFVASLRANLRAVRLAQAALDASTVLAVYLLARALLRSPGHLELGPLIAAAAVAVNPYLIYFSALVLSETLFGALMVWGILMLVAGQRAGHLRWPAEDEAPTTDPRPWRATFLWLGGGLVLALSGLVRPPGIPLALLMGIAAVLLNRPGAEAQPVDSVRSRMRWRLPVGATMLLLMLLVLTPWALRNDQVLGKWIWTTTNGGVTAFDGFNPDATGASDQLPLTGMLPQLRSMNEVERSEYLNGQASNFIRQQPRRAVELAVLKAARTWSPIPLSEQFGNRRNLVIGFLYAVPLDVLIIAGLLLRGLSRSAKAFLLLPAVYFTIVHMLTVGSLRYRMPAEPLMAVIAASAITTWIFSRQPAAADAEEVEESEAHAPAEITPPEEYDGLGT